MYAMAVKKKQALYPVREPNGRMSRSTEAAVQALPPAEVKRLLGAARDGLRDPMWGTELGRYLLDGEINNAEYEAGRRWGRLVTAYYEAIDARPPHPKAAALFLADPAAEPEPESEEGQRRLKVALRVVADMKEAHAILRAAGEQAEKAVRQVCEVNELPVQGAGYLRLGLRWLALHWGLTKN